jgi:hypothetical protein
MGAVYEAEQDHPRRVVALKIIKAAWRARSCCGRSGWMIAGDKGFPDESFERLGAMRP